jgi:ubiquinone/menaquinone biosynthesis C-methylase UbiE
LAITTPAEPDAALRVVQCVHERLVSRRRTRVLAGVLADLVPPGTALLDVGCGDGTIAYLIGQTTPTVSIQGLEVMPRRSCLIECRGFNGTTLPLPESSVDICLFVDVLHHTDHIEGLLREARRVARRYVLIKDHLCESRFHHAVLSFMDWVGNRAHGVVLRYNYQSKVQWYRILSACGLRPVSWNGALPLYPPPFNLVFGRGLHFVALCEKS